MLVLPWTRRAHDCHPNAPGIRNIYEARLPFHAAATLTLALPKIAFRQRNVLALTGGLFLADIGVPPELYRALGISVGYIFAKSEIVQLKSQI